MHNAPLYNIKCKTTSPVNETKNIASAYLFSYKSLVVIIFCHTFALAFTASSLSVSCL
ncbi:hypothetical protein HMPREF9144_2018 [Prevotella pallens ATCC 700821]|uniref:Uncharacterized protein n=1 Tax=Prevotella pallens ATCC 700821 TaxID=997353 RepID=F9DK26_9BACT|nr:hypothetical protein HMPREF9144_2018 [Prevotella pallens ATCC 700821]